MRRRISLLALTMTILSLLAACGSSAANRPAATPSPIPTDTPQPGTFYFTTDDGVTLNGQIFGAGKTALIFSNGKGLPKLEWRPTAQTLASRGYLCLIYDYRGLDQSQGRDDPDQREHDLRAAIMVARARGATNVALLGSSFGALLAAKLASEAHAQALVSMSSPTQDGAIRLSDADLQALTMPKLFMASQDDHPFASSTQQLYDATPQPKQIVIYPGDKHGTDLFSSQSDALQRVTTFLLTNAPTA